DPSDKLIRRVEHHGAVIGGADYTEMVNATLPGVLPGVYRVIVTSDSRALVPDLDQTNNTAASSSTINVDVTPLVLGTTVSGIIANRQDLFFKFDTLSGLDVQITASFTVAAQAEVFVRRGAIPDRSNFDGTAPSVLDRSQL